VKWVRHGFGVTGTVTPGVSPKIRISPTEGDPSHVEDTGAKTAWHFHEATGSLLRKEYADGNGPEYAYNEAVQLKERRWAREEKGPRMNTN